MKILINKSPVIGTKCFCSWDRIAADVDGSLFGLRTGEKIVALEVSERGVQAVVEREPKEKR